MRALFFFFLILKASRYRAGQSFLLEGGQFKGQAWKYQARPQIFSSTFVFNSMEIKKSLWQSTPMYSCSMQTERPFDNEILCIPNKRSPLHKKFPYIRVLWNQIIGLFESLTFMCFNFMPTNQPIRQWLCMHSNANYIAFPVPGPNKVWKFIV